MESVLLLTFYFGLKIPQVLKTSQLFASQGTQSANFSFIQFTCFMVLPRTRKGLSLYSSVLSQALLQPACLVSAFLNFVQNFFQKQSSDGMRDCMEAVE